jgi:hypothetical protein
LIESRWDVWGFENWERSFSFRTQGFGLGEMRWSVPAEGSYRVALSGPQAQQDLMTLRTSGDRVLSLQLKANAIEPLQIEIRRE